MSLATSVPPGTHPDAHMPALSFPSVNTVPSEINRGSYSTASVARQAIVSDDDIAGIIRLLSASPPQSSETAVSFHSEDNAPSIFTRDFLTKGLSSWRDATNLVCLVSLAGNNWSKNLGRIASIPAMQKSYDLVDHKSLKLFTRLSAAKPASWSQDATERVAYLQSLDDGWLGTGSKGATRETVREALAFLRKYEMQVPDTFPPTIGLDSDGAIVFSWDEADLTGSLSIFGDGTYAFYVERGALKSDGGEERLSDPLPHALIEALAA